MKRIATATTLAAVTLATVGTAVVAAPAEARVDAGRYTILYTHSQVRPSLILPMRTPAPNSRGRAVVRGRTLSITQHSPLGPGTTQYRITPTAHGGVASDGCSRITLTRNSFGYRGRLTDCIDYQRAVVTLVRR
ncbi:MAG: hypothetical protein QM774_06765 [Gordonia sp. (in: high G+C Gram-positive bacteria)]|uniref:hypothetical protein n=1 Tax=Gordonia sp. (in: high G+C Gram-positive bacteria) TaxID=84139 RepID=UPI0039E37C3A